MTLTVVFFKAYSSMSMTQTKILSILYPRIKGLYHSSNSITSLLILEILHVCVCACACAYVCVRVCVVVVVVVVVGIVVVVVVDIALPHWNAI